MAIGTVPPRGEIVKTSLPQVGFLVGVEDKRPWHGSQVHQYGDKQDEDDLQIVLLPGQRQWHLTLAPCAGQW